jgi:hypothetical protein
VGLRKKGRGGGGREDGRGGRKMEKRKREGGRKVGERRKKGSIFFM